MPKVTLAFRREDGPRVFKRLEQIREREGLTKVEFMEKYFDASRQKYAKMQETLKFNFDDITVLKKLGFTLELTMVEF